MNMTKPWKKSVLCFGWIDSKPNKLDDERSILWMAPRKPAAKWSRPYKERVPKSLINAELMAPVGLAKIEEAIKDGSWYALDRVEALKIPATLTRRLWLTKLPGSTSKPSPAL